MNLQSYLKHRRVWEVVMVTALVAFGCFSNVATELIDYARDEDRLRPAMAWLLEGTSHAALLVAFPLVVWFDRRFPIRVSTWRTSVPAHLGFTVVFSAVHVALMFAARRVLFPTVIGAEYRWDDVPGEFFYEYLKDFRTYFLILAVLYLYRFVLVRLQGEAGFLDAGESERESQPPADRFLVKKFGKEFLVRIDDIEWIESAGNYVNLHVEKKVYPLRSTMTQIADRLAPQGFIRVHRQAIVNADRIAEMSVSDSGDGELRLNTDARVPVSRRYRQHLRESIGADQMTA
ncbi:MAG: LytTR family DNA-binding domain-containing protein [Pseudomonadota bacterium]